MQTDYPLLLSLPLPASDRRDCGAGDGDDHQGTCDECPGRTTGCGQTCVTVVGKPLEKSRVAIGAGTRARRHSGIGNAGGRRSLRIRVGAWRGRRVRAVVGVGGRRVDI